MEPTLSKAYGGDSIRTPSGGFGRTRDFTDPSWMLPAVETWIAQKHEFRGIKEVIHGLQFTGQSGVKGETVA